MRVFEKIHRMFLHENKCSDGYNKCLRIPSLPRLLAWALAPDWLLTCVLPLYHHALFHLTNFFPFNHVFVCGLFFWQLNHACVPYSRALITTLYRRIPIDMLANNPCSTKPTSHAGVRSFISKVGSWNWWLFSACVCLSYRVKNKGCLGVSCFCVLVMH